MTVTIEQLEDGLVECAAGLILARHDDAVARDCAIRLALDIYQGVFAAHLAAVAEGQGAFVEGEPEVATAEKKASNQ